MNIESKDLSGKIVEFKELPDRNGVPIGIVKGYMATWDLDRGNGWMQDRFHKGAFKKAIARHKKDNNRPIRLKHSHKNVIGGVPIDTVKEDAIGLYGEAEINLELEEGRNVYSLIKQGVISQFSIGFQAKNAKRNYEKNERDIYESEVWEATLTEEPMNENARVTEVKAMTEPLSVVDIEFSADEAKSRVNDIDDASPGYIGKFLIGDVVDNELVAIKEAIFLASGEVKKLPKEEQEAYIVELDKYYAKMNIKSPFSDEPIVDAETARNMKPRELENILASTGMFSQKAAKIIASSVKTEKKDDEPGLKDLVSGIKSLTEKLS